MIEILYSIGILGIPLLICLFISIFICVDRIFALRESKLGVLKLQHFLLNGQVNKNITSPTDFFEKIISFFYTTNPSIKELNAYVNLELNKLERGLFLLDTVISIAPLLGLLGTIFGLTHVFSYSINVDTSMTNEVLSHGIALALTTTALGLIIAIPTIIANNIFIRKLDKIYTITNLLTEHLIKRDLK